MKTTKAQRIFENGLSQAKDQNEIQYLHIYIDSMKYPKRLKLQIIEVAKQNGYNFKLDGSKLYNDHTKRYFLCNNIVNC